MTPGTSTQYRRILLYYNGTKAAGRALRTALDPAREHEAELFVVAVALPRLMENVDDKSLAELSFYSQQNRLRAHFEVLQGEHAEELARAAERHGARSSLAEQLKQRLRQLLLVVH